MRGIKGATKDDNVKKEQEMFVCSRDAYLRYERGSEDIKNTPLVLPLLKKEIYAASARILCF